MRRNQEFVICEAAGEYIMIPTGNTALRFHHLIILNKDQTEESLLRNVMRTYEVDEGTARKDIADFIERLKDGPIIGEDEYVLYRRK